MHRGLFHDVYAEMLFIAGTADMCDREKGWK